MTTKRFLVPALVGLLVAGILGLGGGAGAVEPRLAIARTITIPAAAFHPASDDTDFYNYSERLSTTTGSGTFLAPLFFEAPEVNIRRITLFARDDGPASVCVYLLRSNPATPGGGGQEMSRVCSAGTSAEYPVAFTQKTFNYRKVTGAYGPSLLVSLPGPASEDYAFFGVRIVYAYEG